MALNQSIKPSRKVGRYANLFRVGFNAFEVVIEFGERFAGEETPMHTRIITNPVFARGLVDSLRDALADYARAYASGPGTGGVQNMNLTRRSTARRRK
jgi:hypothetical protein